MTVRVINKESNVAALEALLDDLMRQRPWDFEQIIELELELARAVEQRDGEMIL